MLQTAPTCDNTNKIFIGSCPARDELLEKFDHRKEILAQEISFDMVTRIGASWDVLIQHRSDWKPVVGELFLRKMIQIAPDTIAMFGFRLDMRFDDPDLMKDENFSERALAFMGGLEMTVDLMGPDVSLLEEILVDLGVKHQKVPCREEHWPVVCESAVFAMKQALGEKFTAQYEREWILLLRFISHHMLNGFRRPAEAV